MSVRSNVGVMGVLLLRIIDKNNDFYDYLQNVYRDNSITFDRTDSFVLTKEIMCNHLVPIGRWWDEESSEKYRFVLLQVCNTFWLFLVEITSFAKQSWHPLEYKADLLAQWKNYNRERCLIKVDVVVPNAYQFLKKYVNRHWVYDRQLIIGRIPMIMNLIDTGDYKVSSSIDKHTVYYGSGYTVSAEKHIPLLKASGLPIGPLDIYLSFEEYFSQEKQSQERTESRDITDKEKIENHGFDTTVSFRGK